MNQQIYGIDVPKKNNSVRWLAMIAAAVILFSIGYGLGKGNIRPGQKKIAGTNQSLPGDLDYSSVEQVYDLLRTNYDGEMDETKLLDGLKQGMANATGDPYTEYFNGEKAKEFDDQINGTFSGIGAELGKDDQERLIVVAPLSGSPAEKSGVKPRDVIVQIDGTSTRGMTIAEAVKKIRGNKGTNVKLTIVRNETDQQTFDITRDVISVPSVEYKVLEGNIGFMQISRFGPDTAELASKAADDFIAANVSGIILDLRGNPGGEVDAAIAVSNLWLERGKTIFVEKRDGKAVRTYTATDKPKLKGKKTIILINEGSASASEITAGALHDNDAAKLLGTKSFGKGKVQQLLKLADGGELKVTIAHWYTPNDINIDKTGIEPDVKVMISESEAKSGKDPQKDKALEIIKQ